MFVGEDHILTKIECSDLEKKIIENNTKMKGQNLNEKNYYSN